jgi:PKD repeat protein
MKYNKKLIIICAFILILASSGTLCISSEEKKPPKNLPPTVEIDADVTTGLAPLSVSFKADADDPDGFIDSYEWDFGDETTSSREKILHTYYTSGLYDVTLTVKDNKGDSATDTIQISVEDELLQNEPPNADASVEPNVAFVHEELSFLGTGDDDDGWITSFDWDFDGDGNFDWQSNTTGFTKYAYEISGEYTAVFQVTDNNFETDTDSVFVTIQPTENQPPNAVISQPQNNAEFEVDEVIQFDGSESNDPDDDTLTYSWDFGDGDIALEAKPSHSYSEEGNFTVQLTVNDGQESDTESITIRIIIIENHPPNADIVSPEQDDVFQVNTPVTFDGTNSSDPDGDFIYYYWDFGDGSVGTGPTTTHVYLAVGTYNVVLRVEDNELSDTDGVRILIVSEPVNQPPEAVIDEPSNGENFTIDEEIRFNGSGSNDPDGDVLNYTWDFQDGTLGYGMITTHHYSENGTYNVTLTVFDGQYTDIANVVIIIGPRVDINTPPTAIISEPTVLSTYETNREVDCIGNLSFDPDNSPLTYDWDFGDDTEHSTEENTVHYYTTEGVYLILLTVSDGVYNDTDSVVITVVESSANNSAPTAEIVTPTTGQSFAVNEVITFDGSNSTDPDNDTLKYTWTFGDGSSGSGVITTHKYTSPGLYTIILEVSDGQLNDTDRVRIIINIQFRSVSTTDENQYTKYYIDIPNNNRVKIDYELGFEKEPKITNIDFYQNKVLSSRSFSMSRRRL